MKNPKLRTVIKELLEKVVKEQDTQYRPKGPQKLKQKGRNNISNVKSSFSNAKGNEAKAKILLDHWRSLGMDDNEIKNHVQQNIPMKLQPGCSANSIAEDLYYEQALPNMDMGKGAGGREERILGWILGCGVVIGLLNIFRVGQGGGGGGTGPGSEGEDDCFFDPNMC